MLKKDVQYLIEDKLYDCGLKNHEYSLGWVDKLESYYLELMIDDDDYKMFIEQFEDFYIWLTVHYKNSQITIQQCLN